MHLSCADTWHFQLLCLFCSRWCVSILCCCIGIQLCSTFTILAVSCYTSWAVSCISVLLHFYQALLYIFDRRYIALQIATDLSVNQTDDILWIRRLFYRKLGQLARHRKALLSRMTQSQVDTCHASEKLSGLTDWGECLHQNGLDEYRTWLQFALCLMRGVSLLHHHVLMGLLVRFARNVSLQHPLMLGCLSGLTIM